MNPLTQTLRKKVKAGEKIVCAFLTLGYPSLAWTKKLIHGFEKSGVDVIELGFPFSDPLADGPTIQKASDSALRRHVCLEDAFRLVRSLRKEGSKIPIIFFSYFNPMFHMGIKTFAKSLRQSGFQGVVVPDLPPEEAKSCEKVFQKLQLAQVYLIAPTTRPDRMRVIAQKSEGFIYYVSLRGVTGARKELPRDLSTQVKKLKRLSDKAVLVGFGVSSVHHVKQICQFADGVIIGSAIINSLSKSSPTVGKTVHFVKSIVHAAKNSFS